MAEMGVQQVLEQMRALQAQASAGTAQPVQPGQQAPQGDFASTLRSAIDSVNGLQQDSSQKADAFIRGEDISLAEVMVAGQKSRVAFEAMKQTRNRLLEAYQEIARMQV